VSLSGRDGRVLAVAAAAVVLALLISALVVAVLGVRRSAATRRAAALTAEELALQRQLLEAFGTRLEAFAADSERVGRQLAAARRATFPVLRAAWKFGGMENPPVGSVDYVGGSEPALDVAVLVRWRDRDHFLATLEMVGPLTRSVPFSAVGCDAATVARQPVPDDPFKLPDAESAGLAVIWTDPDGSRRWWGQRYRFSFGFPEPEGPALSGTAPEGQDAPLVRLTGTATRPRPLRTP
jgi:hypothetical protein